MRRRPKSFEEGGVSPMQPAWADLRFNEIITDDLNIHVAWVSAREWNNPKARRIRAAFPRTANGRRSTWEWLLIDRTRIRSI